MTAYVSENDQITRQLAAAKQIDVVTLNTWKGDGEYAARLCFMAEELRRLDPDILLLQECFSAPSLALDTLETLADASGFYKASWPGRSKVRVCEGIEAVSTSGLAVLSRYRILSSRVLYLPSDPRDGERAALLVEIDHPSGTILAVSLHLTHLTGGDTLRRQQFQFVTAEISKSPPTTTVIVGGDFNATLDEGFIQAALPHGRLIDCRELAGVDPESTMPHGNACIDHILMLDREGGENKKVLRVTTVFDRPDAQSGLLPSDHFGVRVSFA